MEMARTREDASFFARLGEGGVADAALDPPTDVPEAVDETSAAPSLPQKKPRKPDRRRALTRRAIIEAASQLFLARGVEATTIEDIAAAAELSAGTLYFHFGSKENVLLALVAAVVDADVGYLSAADRTDSALDRVLEASDTYLRFALQQPVAFDYIVAGLPELASDAPETAVAARGVVAARVRAFASAVASDLQQAMDDGAIDAAPLDEVLALVWSVWNGVAGLIRRNDEFAISAEFGERVVARGRSMLLGGLVRERPSA